MLVRVGQGFRIEGLRFGPTPKTLDPENPTFLAATSTSLNAAPKAKDPTPTPQTPQTPTRATRGYSEAPTPEALGSQAKLAQIPVENVTKPRAA